MGVEARAAPGEQIVVLADQQLEARRPQRLLEPEIKQAHAHRGRRVDGRLGGVGRLDAEEVHLDVAERAHPLPVGRLEQEPEQRVVGGELGATVQARVAARPGQHGVVRGRAVALRAVVDRVQLDEAVELRAPARRHRLGRRRLVPRRHLGRGRVLDRGSEGLFGGDRGRGRRQRRRLRGHVRPGRPRVRRAGVGRRDRLPERHARDQRAPHHQRSRQRARRHRLRSSRPSAASPAPITSTMRSTS